jgi:hypothetical protein
MAAVVREHVVPLQDLIQDDPVDEPAEANAKQQARSRESPTDGIGLISPGHGPGGVMIASLSAIAYPRGCGPCGVVRASTRVPGPPKDSVAAP